VSATFTTSATDSPSAAAILHKIAMLGLAVHFSISTTIPLLTPERRDNSSNVIFCFCRSCLSLRETASLTVWTSAPGSVDILTLLVIGS
jgi:hypothetical protein